MIHLDAVLYRLAGPGDKVVPFDEFRRRRDQQEQQRTDQQRRQIGDVFNNAFETMSQDPGFQYPGYGEFGQVWEKEGILRALLWYRDHRGKLDPKTDERIRRELGDALQGDSSSFNVMVAQVEDFYVYTTQSNFPGYRSGTNRTRGIMPSYWQSVLFGSNEEAIQDALMRMDPRMLSQPEWEAAYAAFKKWLEAIRSVARVVLSPIRPVQ